MTLARPRPLLPLMFLWLTAILALTLSSAQNTPPLTLETFACVGCGGRDTADIIVNCLAFLPGGVLMTLAFGGTRAVLLATCLTVLVETVQIGIPGRDPALQDLISNTLGALSGVLLVRRGLGRRSQRALLAFATLAWLAPAFLLTPMTSSAPELYGQWTPVFTGVERYQGKVLAASVAGHPVRSGPVRERAPLDTGIVGRRPIQLLLEVGPPPTGPAPVFQVVDDRRTMIVSLSALGTDLILRGNNPSQMLRLDQPPVRWHGALDDVVAGDTAAVVIDRARDSVCMSVGRRTACRLAPSLGGGWEHLVELDEAPGWLIMMLGFVWSMGLGALLGGTSTGTRGALSGGIAVAALGLGASWVSPDVRPDLLHASLFAIGSAVGFLLRAPTERLWAGTRTQ